MKRVDLGVFNVIKAVQAGKFKGNHDLKFTLANGGMSVGEINPAVPERLSALVDHLLEKDPALRPQSAGQVRRELAGTETEPADPDAETTPAR